MNDEELKEMLKLYTKKDLWEFNQIKAKKQIELMAQIKEQDQKIKELEHRLANCIEPKFKVGDKVWHCFRDLRNVTETVIECIEIEVYEGVIDINYYDIEGFGFGVEHL